MSAIDWSGDGHPTANVELLGSPGASSSVDAAADMPLFAEHPHQYPFDEECAHDDPCDDPFGFGFALG